MPSLPLLGGVLILNTEGIEIVCRLRKVTGGIAFLEGNMAGGLGYIRKVLVSVARLPKVGLLGMCAYAHAPMGLSQVPELADSKGH